MSAIWKLWQLKVPKVDRPIALTDTWDRAQILAKRLGLSEFEVSPVYADVDEIPITEVHNGEPLPKAERKSDN